MTRPLRTLDHLSLALAIHEARSSTPWDDASDHARDDAIACAVAAAGWFTANGQASEETFVPLADLANEVMANLAEFDRASAAVESALADRLAVELSRKGGPYGDEPEGAAGEAFDIEVATAAAALEDRFTWPAVRLVPREAGE